MRYDIIIKPSAEKSFAKLPALQQRKIFSAIELLVTNPKPSGVKELKSSAELYRIRVGDYRVIYSIENDVLTINIVKIGHRSDIYRG